MRYFWTAPRIYHKERHLKFTMCISLVGSAADTRSAIALQKTSKQVHSTKQTQTKLSE